jgi:BirA family transcriptional regulator, biotin operon repressor / biotin---[acetyl-CoA-carboxylase] ligase
MQLPLSRAVAPGLELLAEVGSTNAELGRRASAGPLADFTVIATTNQTDGKGRLGRVWIAPPETTVAVSVLLAPGEAQVERLGWLPLLAGLAMTRAVASLVTEHAVALKWPNDVQIDGLKVAGLLAEFVPSARAVIIGAGLNLTMSREQLPTETSTSLTLNGVDEAGIVDAALSRFLAGLKALYATYTASGLDASASGLHAAVSSACSTIGQRVRVELPGGDDLRGTAEGLDALGRLLVRTDAALEAIAAGDVTHVRFT